MHVSKGTPLLPGFSDSSNESENTLGELQGTITERIQSLLGYEISNQFLIQFIDTFGHPDQLKCKPNDSKKRLHNTQIRYWENIFTDSFYRAAVIVATKMKEDHPELQGINMEEVIFRAKELVQTETNFHSSPINDIEYRE